MERQICTSWRKLCQRPWQYRAPILRTRNALPTYFREVPSALDFIDKSNLPKCKLISQHTKLLGLGTCHFPSATQILQTIFPHPSIHCRSSFACSFLRTPTISLLFRKHTLALHDSSRPRGAMIMGQVKLSGRSL